MAEQSRGLTPQLSARSTRCNSALKFLKGTPLLALRCFPAGRKQIANADFLVFFGCGQREQPKQPKQKRSYVFALPTTLQLSRVAMSRLRQRAKAIGVNEAELASDLLEMIAQDDLYDAVLDRAKDA